MRMNWLFGIGSTVVIGLVVYKYINKKTIKVKEESMSIKSELIKLGKKFDGLYESTYQLLKKSIDEEVFENIVYDWNARLEKDVEFPILSRKWKNINNQGSNNMIVLDTWIKFIFGQGVVRSEEEKVVISDVFDDKYIYNGNDTKSIGLTVDVIKPYWYFEDVILEKGMCK